MIPRKLVNYLTRKQAKKDGRTPALVHGELVQRVAVVACHKFSAEAVAYVERLRQRGVKQVDFYLGFPNKKTREQFVSPIAFTVFSPTDFTLTGKLKNPALQVATQAHYDVLVDLSMGQMAVADLLIAKLSAKWKAGRKTQGREHLLDLLIDSTANCNELIHYMDQYLLNLNKTKAA